MFCPKCGTQNPETGKFCRACGTDLGNVSTALSGNLNRQPEYYTDKKGRRISNAPSDIVSRGIKEIIVGIGFVVATILLYTTNIWGGRNWWWALLFPAFGSLAKGISEIVRYGMMENEREQFSRNPQNFFENSAKSEIALPPNKTEYVKPQSSIYDTGELAAPPSVTEGTTRHLEINKDGETMTLPKNKG